jgi:hypothetical protein
VRRHRVSDNLLPNAVGISCYSTYSHALLLGLADPCAMSVRQIELTDRWLAMWARQGLSVPQQRETEGPVITIDLEGGGRVRRSRPAGLTIRRRPMRFGYPAKLATSVRGRLKRLQSGASPAELQLGHDCSIEQCTALSGHLDSRWYQLSRRRLGSAGKDRSSLLRRPSGRVLSRHRSHVRRARIRGAALVSPKPSSCTRGAGPDYDRGRESAEAEWAWEHWEGTCERREASLVRTSDPRYRWVVDQLAIVRTGGEVRIGFVTRVALGADGQPGCGRTARARVADVVRQPGRHDAAAAFGGELGRSAAAGAALRRDPRGQGHLVLPPRTFNPSRVLRALDFGTDRRFRLTRLLHRGIDFERVAFEETNR